MEVVEVWSQTVEVVVPPVVTANGVKLLEAPRTWPPVWARVPAAAVALCAVERLEPRNAACGVITYELFKVLLKIPPTVLVVVLDRENIP